MARKTDMILGGSGGGLGRRIMTGLVALVLLTLVIRNPAGSAHTVVGVVEWASNVIDALSTFGQALSGKA